MKIKEITQNNAIMRAMKVGLNAPDDTNHIVIENIIVFLDDYMVNTKLYGFIKNLGPEDKANMIALYLREDVINFVWDGMRTIYEERIKSENADWTVQYHSYLADVLNHVDTLLDEG